MLTSSTFQISLFSANLNRDMIFFFLEIFGYTRLLYNVPGLGWPFWNEIHAKCVDIKSGLPALLKVFTHNTLSSVVLSYITVTISELLIFCEKVNTRLVVEGRSNTAELLLL